MKSWEQFSTSVPPRERLWKGREKTGERGENKQFASSLPLNKVVTHTSRWVMHDLWDHSMESCISPSGQ